MKSKEGSASQPLVQSSGEGVRDYCCVRSLSLVCRRLKELPLISKGSRCTLAGNFAISHRQTLI
jgi:hypothetical protein